MEAQDIHCRSKHEKIDTEKDRTQKSENREADMYIQTRKNGMVKYINHKSYMNIKWSEKIAYDYQQQMGEESPDCIQVSVYEGKINFISLPAYYRGELFYAEYEGGYLISDSLFLLCQKLGKVNIEPEMSRYFKHNGYCPIGFTFFKQVYRLKVHSIYTFSEDGLVLNPSENFSGKPNHGLLDNDLYKLFKDTLNAVIDETITENNGILLSGGVDSRLLLLLLRERDQNVEAISGVIKPYFMVNCSDVYWAERIAKMTGTKIEKPVFDYTDVCINDLLPIIEYMPFCAHIGLSYLKMLSAASKYNNITIFSGQNADNLYNLGPTERITFDRLGIANWLRRFYISEEYIRTLKDVEGILNPMNIVIANAGKMLFRKVRNQPELSLPRFSDELIWNFSHANDYTILWNKSSNLEMGNERRTAFEVKQKLFQTKFNYLKGGDSQAIETAGFLNGLNIELPYSKQKMVDYFRNIRLTGRDTWKPKRFSYRYVKEFISKYGKEIADFSKPSDKELRQQFGEALDLNGIFGYVIEKTQFGSELREGAKEKPSGHNEYLQFNSLLRLCWFNKVIEIVKDKYGVLIE